MTLSNPRFMSAVRVVPGGVIDVEMHSSAEIEQIGMEITMKFERGNRRVPEDVATENLGFDVRSTDPTSGEKRYLEVKARASVGAVAQTQYDRFKAQRFQDDYYLYVIRNAAIQPKLYRIQNPATALHPYEKVEVRYMINTKDIFKSGVVED